MTSNIVPSSSQRSAATFDHGRATSSWSTLMRKADIAFGYVFLSFCRHLRPAKGVSSSADATFNAYAREMCNNHEFPL